VVNLFENAVQAVGARQASLDGNETNYEPQVKVSTYGSESAVFIEVQDNGIGMDQETAKRAFEPLFTTRARGTGLGLAIVRKIVEEHNGTVYLNSEPHLGTTVTVVIPFDGRAEK
jgi:signal transduction histidine kinase